MMFTDEDDIERRLANLDDLRVYPSYKPLTEAADEYWNWARRPEERVYMGIPEFDAAMRGTAPGEMTLMGGYTHSGKTLVMTEMLLRNPDVPMILFTPDETRPLVLTKLTAALTGVGAEALEQMIQQDDDTGRQLLRDTAEKFNRLAVFDDVVTTVTMDNMLDEVTDAWGEKPRAVVFDYARLLSGVEDMEGKIRALKNWGKRQNVAMFVITQSSRTMGSGGKRQGIDSVEYGGEALATHLITVRRKKYAIKAMIDELEDRLDNMSNPNRADEYRQRIMELQIAAEEARDTITVALVKNKRPPSKLVEDMDFRIETSTGRLVAPPSRHVAAYQSQARTGLTATQLLEERHSQIAMFEGGGA